MKLGLQHRDSLRLGRELGCSSSRETGEEKKLGQMHHRDDVSIPVRKQLKLRRIASPVT